VCDNFERDGLADLGGEGRFDVGLMVADRVVVNV
jgi:hypothetical protein